MEHKATSHVSSFCKLTLALALFLASASAARQERTSVAQGNPCSTLPAVCHYTYDPVENCCVADPRFDCYDACF